MRVHLIFVDFKKTLVSVNRHQIYRLIVPMSIAKKVENFKIVTLTHLLHRVIQRFMVATILLNMVAETTMRRLYLSRLVPYVTELHSYKTWSVRMM
jgi:hypothetical protein